MTDPILTEIADGIATVTLNRPEAVNALSKALRHRLYEVMTALDADDSVRAVILTGAGERAFTPGLDLKELGSEEGALGALNAEDAYKNPVKAIEVCRKPVIGAINGVAITKHVRNGLPYFSLQSGQRVDQAAIVEHRARNTLVPTQIGAGHAGSSL